MVKYKRLTRQEHRKLAGILKRFKKELLPLLLRANGYPKHGGCRRLSSAAWYFWGAFMELDCQLVQDALTQNMGPEALRYPKLLWLQREAENLKLNKEKVE
jgi:hypothetical protein